MGAVVKNPTTQLAQASVPGPNSALFLDESLARIPTITSKEIRRLSRFLPVIVLITEAKSPVSFVPTERTTASFLSVWMTVMLAPATTPPDLSVTRPEMEPVISCAVVTM
jgi:hypothetical protein